MTCLRLRGCTYCDENGLPRVYRRYGQALVLSITLVPGKAYTAAVTQCKTKDVAACAAEGGSLMAIQTNDPRITLVSDGYPLFVDGKIAGGIGVGGGTEEQDCAIAEYVLSVFEELTKCPMPSRRMGCPPGGHLPWRLHRTNKNRSSRWSSYFDMQLCSLFCPQEELCCPIWHPQRRSCGP